jgi:hypothetical protein
MKVAFHLAHPAHFHLFKNTIILLKESSHIVIITYNDKDVLGNLINTSPFKDDAYRIKALKNVNSSLALKIQFIQKIIGVFLRYLKFRPDIVLGTSVIISLVGKLLPFKSIIVNEDDFDVVNKTVELGYPSVDNILCPSVCRTGRFDYKSIKYNGYHELAYLHPNNFKANRDIVEKYFLLNKPIFIIRFAKLKAHHDSGIKGISPEFAKKIINILEPYGKVFITSEIELEARLEKHRTKINPIDIHHVLAYATLYIGDSQTMAAEAGVLGTPFIRFNDFVGRISYLNELEKKYNLGYGIHPENPEQLLQKLDELMHTNNLKALFQERKNTMLSEKIDFSKFLTWFIENYPESVIKINTNPNYQYNFI